MSRFLLLAIVAYGAWTWYSDRSVVQGQYRFADYPDEITNQTIIDMQISRFHCDGRTHCSQMTSRAEAEYFIRNCPNTKMDGDRDGVPCENDSRW